MGNEEGKFLVTNKRNFLLLQYVLPVLVLLVEEQRVVLYILKFSGTKLDLKSVVLLVRRLLKKITFLMKKVNL